MSLLELQIKKCVNNAFLRFNHTNMPFAHQFSSALIFMILMIGSIIACHPNNDTTYTKAINIPLCNNTAIAIDLNNLPIPTLRDGVGNSHFAISTHSKEAQRWFDYGVNMLHCFWHIEAQRAFREVIKNDSLCAMGYWGMAISDLANSNAAKLAIRQATLYSKETTPLEKAFIEAQAVLTNQGIVAAQSSYRKLYQQFPNEPEAIAFAAIILRQATEANTQVEVKNLLENALVKYPEHLGILHYYLHVMELRPDFKKALPFAAKVVNIAPNSPHIKHTPGHLSFLAGDYAQTVNIFEAAKNLEEKYHETDKIPFAANQNYLHNLHYLTVAYSEMGNKEKAIATAEKYANILPLQNPDEATSILLRYQGRILPALVSIRFRDWNAAHEQLTYWLKNNAIPVNNDIVKNYLQAIDYYVLGMKAVEKSDINQAIQHGGALSKAMQLFEKQGIAKQQSNEFKLINQAFDILNMSRYELAGWIDNIDKSTPFNQSAWAEALELEKNIPYDEPPRLMYPISESIGRLHLLRKENQAANKAFEKALIQRPNSPFINKIL
jgi:tetratricopeptide (TPR) repeat protein